jgi:hypothetical protein
MLENDQEMPMPMNYAVLVDCDTVSRNQIDFCLEKIRNLGGIPSIRRLYGDFSSGRHVSWQKSAVDLDFFVVEAPCVVPGKTGVDATLMLDAMELLFTHEPIVGYCIVSSDADFTILAGRLRDSGKTVIGFGMEYTPIPFVRACGLFFHLDEETATKLQAPVVNKTMSANVNNSKKERPPPPKYAPPIPDGNVQVGWAAPDQSFDSETEPTQMKIPIPLVPAPVKSSHWRNLEPFVADDKLYSEWNGE